MKNLPQDFHNETIEFDISYDDEEDYYEFVFLVEDKGQGYNFKTRLQDFMHKEFYILDEFERKELFECVNQKLPFSFELNSKGIKSFKSKIF